jgi:predicted chitinase
LTPISELGGKKKRYAPFYGRGFVQLTWEYNYDAFTKLLASQVGITADLVRNKDLALVPSNAAFIAVYGMKHGTFTGRKLSTYFTATKADFVGARAIINGKDKAATIASISKGFIKLAATL